MSSKKIDRRTQLITASTTFIEEGIFLHVDTVRFSCSLVDFQIYYFHALYMLAPPMDRSQAPVTMEIESGRLNTGIPSRSNTSRVVLVLPESGHLVACDRDVRSLKVAKRYYYYYDLAAVSHKCWFGTSQGADRDNMTMQPLIYLDEEAAAKEAGKSSVFRYNSPLIQVSLIGLVCFCCPGMFNALSGMGGGGQLDHTANNNANTALYTAFAVFGVLGGGIYNIVGPRLTLSAGCSTYVLFAGSFLYYNHHKHQTFVVIAGALLGVGAGLLWAAQGAMMTSYPTRARKGVYISLFWSIFNMGGVVGGFIPFILNYNRSDAGSVSDGTYIAFMAFMTAGTLLSLVILPASKVVRDDGTHCTNIKYSKVTTEALEILKLFGNWKMLLIVPAAWASNFFYTYQFNNVNSALFNLRTRGFNNVFYWGAQMVGSVGIGYLLDFSFESRRTRGFVGIGLVALFGTATWAGGLANQLKYPAFNPPDPLLDFKASGSDYAGPFLLYFCYGLLDAMFQSLVYWVIGALADDSKILSRYVGFYKGVQSAGGAVAWQVDARHVTFMKQLVVNWSLTTVSYPLLAILVMLAVKDGEKELAHVPSALPPHDESYNDLSKSMAT